MEEGAFEGGVGFGFQDKGNRMSQYREEGNMEKRKQLRRIALEKHQMLELKKGSCKVPLGSSNGKSRGPFMPLYLLWLGHRRTL